MNILEKINEFLIESTIPFDWDSKYSHIKVFFDSAKDLKELTKLKKEAIKKVDSRDPNWKDGPVEFFSKQKRKELKDKLGIGVKISSSKDARIDRILHIKNSAGKNTARKFK